MQTNKDKHGLLMIYTGNGKGKTTAALGQMLRAWGWDMKVVMFQFIKDTGLSTGEHRAAQKMNFNIRPLGTGFTWNIKDKDRAETIALEQWNRCQEAMSSGQFDMIILDEVSYALNNSWILTPDNINHVLHLCKPSCICGCFALQELFNTPGPPRPDEHLI